MGVAATKSKADRDAARQAAADPQHEEAARLQGKNEALESVQADLARQVHGHDGTE